MYRIVGADGRVYGPVVADEIRDWILEGRANAQSHVQAGDTAAWRPLGSYPEFLAALASQNLRTSPLPALPLGCATTNGTNGMALAGFIFGLLSFPTICCCCLTVPCAIMGIIFSWIGLEQSNRNQFVGGRGLAIAGLVLSLAGLLLYVIFMLFGLLESITNPTLLR